MSTEKGRLGAVVGLLAAAMARGSCGESSSDSTAVRGSLDTAVSRRRRSFCHGQVRQSAATSRMLRTRMTRSAVAAVVAVGALVGSSAVALAHTTPYSWSAATARVMLQEGATISLPSGQRQELDAELKTQLEKFRPLKLTAQASYESTQNPVYARLAQTYDTYIKRFELAQKTIASGLSIDTSNCVGQGKAVIAHFAEKAGLVEKRYKHFRCSAKSYVLEIPTLEFAPGPDPFVPEVVEGTRRLVGPFDATFIVHVRGKARMIAQRTG